MAERSVPVGSLKIAFARGGGEARLRGGTGGGARSGGSSTMAAVHRGEARLLEAMPAAETAAGRASFAFEDPVEISWAPPERRARSLSPGSGDRADSQSVEIGTGESVVVSTDVAPDGFANSLLVEEGGLYRWLVPSTAVIDGRPTDIFRLAPSFAAVATRKFSTIARAVVRKVVVAVVKQLTGELLDEAARVAFRVVPGSWKDHHGDACRLRSFAPDTYEAPVAQAAPLVTVAGHGPTLLVKATMSQSHTGFRLPPTHVVRGLHERYQGRSLEEAPFLDSRPKAPPTTHAGTLSTPPIWAFAHHKQTSRRIHTVVNQTSDRDSEGHNGSTSRFIHA